MKLLIIILVLVISVIFVLSSPLKKKSKKPHPVEELKNDLIDGVNDDIEGE